MDSGTRVPQDRRIRCADCPIAALQYPIECLRPENYTNPHTPVTSKRHDYHDQFETPASPTSAIDTYRMRRTCRLLASVKPSRYLEAGTPTGLTGLVTHAAPRSTLIYLYSSTLDKLKTFPESSVYRKSVEALTNHRLEIITKAVPAGYEAWAEKAKKLIAEHPEVFNTPEGGVDHDHAKSVKSIFNGRTFVTTKIEKERDEITEEWDGEENLGPELEGVRTTEERAGQSILTKKRPGTDSKTVNWEPEPPLTADQYVN